MNKSKVKALNKKTVIEKIIRDKEVILEDFRFNQRTKLDQASGDDMDNRHIDSKNEETLHELELLNHNVEILEKEISVLKNIPIDMEMDKVQFGSLVETDKSVVLVGAANETVEVDGIDIVGISTASPLFKKMQDQTTGDKFELNGNQHEILSVK